jgi:hypothetical protein
MTHEAFDLAMELELIILDFRHLNHGFGLGDPPFNPIWRLVQMRKATVLQEQTREFRTSKLLDDIKADPQAWKLYEMERELIKDGKQSSTDFRLQQHWGLMSKNAALSRLLDHRKATGATLESLKPLADTVQQTLSTHEDVVIIDWAQYHDYYQIIGYDVLHREVLFCELIKDCTFEDVRHWVKRYLRNGDPVGRTLRSSAVLKELYPIVQPIKENVKPGTLLIFSPSQDLHAVPLHAIPYGTTTDYPFIYYHPVVYCPSSAVLADVVARAVLPVDMPLRATFYGRYGDHKPAAEDSMNQGLEEMKALFVASGADVSLITGKKLSRNAFGASLAKSRLIHYHGHVNGDGLSQHLVLEPDDSQLASASDSNRHGFDSHHVVLGPDGDHSPTSTSQRVVLEPVDCSVASVSLAPRHGYHLQDAFSTSIPAATVMLIGCGSGTQDVALNEDSLGLFTAFFAAGATTVVGSLWPIENDDGLEFSKLFYQASFLRASDQKPGASEGETAPVTSRMRFLDLAKAMQHAVLSMRACDDEWCMEEEKQDMPRDLSRWASFVLQGSWIGQGIV